MMAPAALPAATPSRSVVHNLAQQAPGLREDVLRLALEAASSAESRGLVRRNDLITVIDYSIPSTEPRLFVFDLSKNKLLFRELVAHGKNSGGNVPTHFSNTPESRQSSLGLFVTGSTYVGGNGYSLRLDGLEEGVNDRARARAIVMHGADYVNEWIGQSLGRLGRSWGCPAVRKAISRKLIDRIKGGSPVFAYYPDDHWLSQSAFLRDRGGSSTAVAAAR